MEAVKDLATQLDELRRKIYESMSDDALQEQIKFVASLRKNGFGKRALGVGAQIPDFELTDQTGAIVRSHDVLKMGIMVLSFYRGGWCDFCETELRALRLALPEIRTRGGQLVAVSPQTVKSTMTTAERLLLDYTVLSDVGNRVAESFGLSFEIPPEFRAFHDQYHTRLDEHNGDASYRLPVPATYIVDQHSIIRYAYVNVDYTQRAEPEKVLRVLEEIGAA